MIRLHSPAAFSISDTTLFEPVYTAKALQRCLDAVEKILNLTKHVINYSMIDNLGPPFTFTVWVAARVMLVHGSTIESIDPEKINYFIEALRRMGRYWNVALKHADILDRVYADYLSTGGDPPISLRILKDMRRPALDLSFAMSDQSREETATSAEQKSDRASINRCKP